MTLAIAILLALVCYGLLRRIERLEARVNQLEAQR